eukprot:scaffold6378_cov176-Amphora_coffeaeformis.AAC.3
MMMCDSELSPPLFDGRTTKTDDGQTEPKASFSLLLFDVCVCVLFCVTCAAAVSVRMKKEEVLSVHNSRHCWFGQLGVAWLGCR